MRRAQMDTSPVKLEQAARVPIERPRLDCRNPR